MLHTFSDKSILQKISAEALILIPVWKGNRFIDLNHANKIKESINGNIESLDSTIFRVVKYKDGDSDQRFIVDGQHRQYVIKKYYEEFQVLPLNFQVLIIYISIRNPLQKTYPSRRENNKTSFSF